MVPAGSGSSSGADETPESGFPTSTMSSAPSAAPARPNSAARLGFVFQHALIGGVDPARVPRRPADAPVTRLAEPQPAATA
jgi:hypothetical protein